MINPNNIIISKDVQDKLSVIVLSWRDVRNSRFSQELWEEINNYCVKIQQEYGAPSEAKHLFEASRKLYKSIGIDPTKHRPSSEALLRRIIQRKSLYKVNTLVDAGNYCSMTFHLSLGFYDSNKIEGNISLHLGKSDEGYEGINKGRINVHDRLALFDKVGPFGNPTSDSDRTKITEHTTNPLMVIFLPKDYYEQGDIEQIGSFASRTITTFCGGNIENVTYYR